MSTFIKKIRKFIWLLHTGCNDLIIKQKKVKYINLIVLNKKNQEKK